MNAYPHCMVNVAAWTQPVSLTCVQFQPSTDLVKNFSVGSNSDDTAADDPITSIEI